MNSCWICIERKSTNGILSNEIPASNTSIYLLVNSEPTDSNTQLFKVSCTLANEQFDAATAVTIYPNPTNSKINLTLPNDTRFEKVIIADVTGKIVLEQTQNTA